MPSVLLTDRVVLCASGPDAESFLQNVVTTDLASLGADEARPGALLTPQGKILFDFLVSRGAAETLRLDCRSDLADDLARRLTLYRLRAKVEIRKAEEQVVGASWESDSTSSLDESGRAGGQAIASLRDTRFLDDRIVRRTYGPAVPSADRADWDGRRISAGVAECGLDFPPADAFPHDVLLDLTGGVGFRKGCYVGQEVVSRMQHRGTARRRVMVATADKPLVPHADVRAAGRSLGSLGSASGGRAIAIVRFDKVKASLEAGHAISAGEIEVRLAVPPGAAYALPTEAPAAESA